MTEDQFNDLFEGKTEAGKVEQLKALVRLLLLKLQVLTPAT